MRRSPRWEAVRGFGSFIPSAALLPLPPPRVTFRLVVAPLRGPGQSLSPPPPRAMPCHPCWQPPSTRIFRALHDGRDSPTRNGNGTDALEHHEHPGTLPRPRVRRCGRWLDGPGPLVTPVTVNGYVAPRPKN